MLAYARWGMESDLKWNAANAQPTSESQNLASVEILLNSKAADHDATLEERSH